MINAHKEPNDENQEDKEHDNEFKEVYKGVKKRGTFNPTRPTIDASFCSQMHWSQWETKFQRLLTVFSETESKIDQFTSYKIKESNKFWTSFCSRNFTHVTV